MNKNIIAGDKTTKPKYTYSLNSDDKNLIIGLVTDNSETLTVTADYYGITVNDLCKNDGGILFMLNDIVSDDFSAEVIGEMLVRIFSECNFVYGTGDINFSELFHIPTNFINIEGGKKIFQRTEL